VPDSVEFGINVVSGHHIAVVQTGEVELHAWLEAPLQRHLVNGDGALALPQ
jgi:hypothetical protein